MAEENDPFAEVEAMRKVAEALQTLKPDAAARVLRWAQDSYRGRPSEAAALSAAAANGLPYATQPPSNQQFTDIAELFAAASPKRGPEKALVAAYWIQQIQGRQDFDAQTINTELKHLGHGVANITVTLGALINLRPQLVIQLRKSGTAMQARKTYRLTREGIQRVERMIIQAE